MKINYTLPQAHPLLLQPELTKEDINFISLLENDDYFEKQVFRIRKMFGVPKKGFSIVDELKKWQHVQEILKKSGGYAKFMKVVEEFGKKYFLSYHWNPTLARFVLYDVFIFPLTTTSVGIYPGIYCDCNPATPHTHEAEEYLLIGIEAQIKKKQLIDWINSNWPEIEERLSTLPKHPHPGFQLTELYKRIIFLRETERRKFDEIADILEKENHEWVFSDNEITSRYSNFKKALGNLRDK